jgi:thiamine transport system ATP-binding protein
VAELAVRHVSKSFGALAVLRDLDLDVPEGSTVSMLGPSGSGKSTLLRIVAGLEAADGGTVELGGRDVTGVPAHQRGVGFVFQDQALFPHMDVGANVDFGLRMARASRSLRRRRVLETLDLVGLTGYAGRDPGTLSGGQAQRVALARALAPRPALLLLDEPLAALDQLLRERLLLELRSMFDELGVTVVAVTHDPTEAAALGQRMAVLLDGRIAQVGEPGSVLARPRSAEVAGLVGQRNVVEGRIQGAEVVCAWGRFPAPEMPAGPVDVLVPPDGVRVDSGGALRGRISGLIFRGGSGFAVIEGEGWPALDVRAQPGWRVGDPVRLAVDPAAVHVMAR